MATSDCVGDPESDSKNTANVGLTLALGYPDR